MRKASDSIMPGNLREPGGTDPGMLATMLAIGLTILAFIFVLFVSTVE